MYCDLWSQYIKVQNLFKGGNYSRKYGTSDLIAISTCLVIGVKLVSTYQYRGKDYDMSIMTGT